MIVILIIQLGFSLLGYISLPFLFFLPFLFSFLFPFIWEIELNALYIQWYANLHENARLLTSIKRLTENERKILSKWEKSWIKIEKCCVVNPMTNRSRTFICKIQTTFFHSNIYTYRANIYVLSSAIKIMSNYHYNFYMKKKKVIDTEVEFRLAVITWWHKNFAIKKRIKMDYRIQQ